MTFTMFWLLRKQLTMTSIPSQQARQTGWRGRYRGQRCSRPLARSACTEKQGARGQSSASLHGVMTQRSASEFCYLRRFSNWVQSDEVHLQSPLFLHGKRQGQVAERIKGHRDLGAHGTNQSWLEETVEDVHDDGVVPLDVVLPRFLGHHLEL